MSSDTLGFDLRTSPSGRWMGTWATRGPRGSFSLCVLPKPWNVVSPLHNFRPNTHNSLAVSELQSTLVFGPGDEIQGLASRMRASSTTDAYGLFTIGNVRSVEPQQVDTATHSSPDMFAAFFALVANSRALEDDELASLEEDAPTAKDGMLALAFVREVERVHRHLAPLYREIVEFTPAVRGRIETQGLVQRKASGTTGLQCRYDELLLDAGFYRGVATALEVVVRELPEPPFDALSRRLRIPARAAHLRKRLAPIRTAPLRQATELLNDSLIPRTHAAWRHAARLGRAVLRRESFRRHPAHQDQAMRTVSLRIPSDRLWERLLLTALEDNAAFDVVLDGNQAGSLTGIAVPPPWSGLGQSRRPDILTRRRGDIGLQDWLCVDAKYKQLDGTPSAGDLDQMFLYSHHAHVSRDERGPTDFVLAYPGAAARETGPFRRGDGASDIRLWIVEAPFPSPSDLENPVSWRDAVARIAAPLEHLGASSKTAQQLAAT